MASFNGKDYQIVDAPPSMNTPRVVSQADFESFIAAYPRALERNVSGMFEPPILCYHDWDGREGVGFGRGKRGSE